MGPTLTDTDTIRSFAEANRGLFDIKRSVTINLDSHECGEN